MANFKIDGNTVMIGGDVTISSGESLKNFLLNSTPSGDQILVDLKSIESWDSSTIQLFVSWIKSVHGRKIGWKNIPEAMKEDIRILGLFNLFNGVNNE